MRAIVVRNYGGPENLELSEVAVPEPATGQVRITIAAAAVNPVDVLTRNGFLHRMIGDRETVGIGWDIAGTIDAVGAGVSNFAVGDRVIALLDTVAVEVGAYADFVVLAADAVAALPASTELIAAAGLPLNALTADQSLDLLDLAPGQTLLVTGGAGGLGGYTINLAHRRGLRVLTSAGVADEELVRGFGAAEFVPRTEDLAAAVRTLVPGGVDGAVDAAGLGAPAVAAVRDGGGLVAVNMPGPDTERGIAVRVVQVHHDGARLAELAVLADAGELPLRVATTLPLAQAAQAHQLLEKGGVRGRIILTP